MDILWRIWRRSCISTFLRFLDHVAALAASNGQLHNTPTHPHTNTYSKYPCSHRPINSPYRYELAHALDDHSKNAMHKRWSRALVRRIQAVQHFCVFDGTFLMRPFHDKSGLLASDFWPPLVELWSCLSLETKPSADCRAMWLGLQAATH